MTYIYPFILIFNYLLVSNNANINYSPKSLIKFLNKKAGIEQPVFEEIKNSVNSDLGELNGKLFKLTNNDAENYKYIYIGRVNTCRAGGCSAGSSIQSTNLSSEYFDYFIIYDQDVSIKYINIFNYQATHGQEITANGWLKQFFDYNGTSNLNIGKNIDAISGATISVYAITFDIENVTYNLKKLVLT